MRTVLALGCVAALGGFLAAVFSLSERANEPAPAATSSPRRTEVLAAQAVREVVAIRRAGAEAGLLSSQIFGVIGEAARDPRGAGALTLRLELPSLLAAAAIVWPAFGAGDLRAGAEARSRKTSARDLAPGNPQRAAVARSSPP
jgi:hypothetical protein